MQHGKRSASRFMADIRAWGYAVSGLDEVLLMGRTEAPQEYIAVGGEVNWDAPQGCMLHILQRRKLQVLPGHSG